MGYGGKEISVCNRLLCRKPLEVFLLQAWVTEAFTVFCLANKNNGLEETSLCCWANACCDGSGFMQV